MIVRYLKGTDYYALCALTHVIASMPLGVGKVGDSFWFGKSVRMTINDFVSEAILFRTTTDYGILINLGVGYELL